MIKGPWIRMPVAWSGSTFLALTAVVLCLGSSVLWGLFTSRAALAGRPSAVAPTTTASIVATPEPSISPTATPTVLTLVPTATPSPTPTHTPEPTVAPTSTPSPEPTPVPTTTPTPTFTPIPPPDGQLRALSVPILMYHYVSAPPAGADAVRIDLSVSPQLFEDHLRVLRAEGYTSISLFDLALALQMGAPLPEKPVVITLDDGYRDAYTEAFPLLRRYGFRATVFLITGFIDRGLAEYVSWDQVIEMDAAGMEMEAHGHTHPDLRGRDVDYLVWQMLGAKEAIEARTHKPVRFFCYPSGKYDAPAIKVLASAHYWGAVTVNSGVRHCSGAMYELRRIRVRGSDTGRDLVQTIGWTLANPVEGEPCSTMP